MNRYFSLYLDLVRFSAAVLVYVYHSNQRWLTASPLPLSNYGHSSVIVFFVLSGFVIAYVTDTKERDWISYAASRLSRVYSVVVPAVLLTLLLDAVGRQLAPQIYEYPFDQLPLRIIGSLAMLNEVWTVSITYLSNVPYWSITYEFWYYVLFGLLMFLPKPWSYVLAAVTALAVGPKVLLLAPIWWAGVLLYRWKALDRMSAGLAWLLVGASSALIVGLHVGGGFDAIQQWLAGLLGPKLHRELTFSKFFLADYLLCVLVFANFAGMRRLCQEFKAGMFKRTEAAVRFLAGFTFTLYLLHQPLFLFWGSVLRGGTGTIGSWLLVTALTFASVCLIGYFTESKRHRWRQMMVRGLKRLPVPGRAVQSS